QWRRNGAPLSNGGNISGATTATLSINPATPQDTGSYWVLVGNPCLSLESEHAGITVTSGPCYPNCDNSTIFPILNINDFVCFQSHFFIGDSYANCDQSTTPPVLSVNDF